MSIYHDRDAHCVTIACSLDEQRQINDRVTQHYPSPNHRPIHILADGLTIGGRPAAEIETSAIVAGVGRAHAVERTTLASGTVPYLVVYPTDAHHLIQSCIDAGAIPADRPPMCRGDWPSIDRLLDIIDHATDIAAT